MADTSYAQSRSFSLCQRRVEDAGLCTHPKFPKYCEPQLRFCVGAVNCASGTARPEEPLTCATMEVVIVWPQAEPAKFITRQRQDTTGFVLS